MQIKNLHISGASVSYFPWGLTVLETIQVHRQETSACLFLPNRIELIRRNCLLSSLGRFRQREGHHSVSIWPRSPFIGCHALSLSTDQRADALLHSSGPASPVSVTSDPPATVIQATNYMQSFRCPGKASYQRIYRIENTSFLPSFSILTLSECFSAFWRIMYGFAHSTPPRFCSSP
jgi:hypothetical protein